MTTYYTGKLESLKDIFGSEDVQLDGDRLIVDGRAYPIFDDVIILLDPSQYPSSLKNRFEVTKQLAADHQSDFAEDIQYTFGEEWNAFSDILPEHEQQFLRYFDLVDLSRFEDSRVCDLGCGIGRWGYFLREKCRELVLVDFSEAIFVARHNLKEQDNALFFMGDLTQLPFRDDFADFIFCLGVLHNLPTDALDASRKLKQYAQTLLVYLYYALDNRPVHFRMLLATVTVIRKALSRIRVPALRLAFTWWAAIVLYVPLILLGRVVKPLGMARYIPLYETYNDKTMEHIRQNVYDRFFTGIEQRFSKEQIMGLEDTFSEVVVSDQLPYWHFICRR